MNFVGSKGGAGIAQWIISAMPAHRVYVEAFLGRGVVLRTKLPAAVNVGIERDPIVISRYWRRYAKSKLTLLEENALDSLRRLELKPDCLVYADPPYLMESRSCQRNYYGCEFSSVEDHKQLLTVLQALPCMVMLSGYVNSLYADRLVNWRCLSKWTTNRRGVRVEEKLWLNFPEPVFFHDTRFSGSDFTDRQRIKRKCERWKRKLLAMPPGERAAVIDALSSVVDRK